MKQTFLMESVMGQSRLAVIEDGAPTTVRFQETNRCNDSYSVA